ncbi:hypothetical protein SY2F82_35030 [Streptomyces sp. Y2F8-2]|nr:hypothetical protein SY2F82_35030 [Streptomyces sp. Y2F8-2]
MAEFGFRGLDDDVLDPVIITGFTATRTRKITPGQKVANRVLAVGRAPVEHGVPISAVHGLNDTGCGGPSIVCASCGPVRSFGMTMTARRRARLTQTCGLVWTP